MGWWSMHLRMALGPAAGLVIVPDRPWKQEEREVARLLGGIRYPANSGGRVDVEGPTTVAQVKHIRRLSLAQLEALALEMEGIGSDRGKVGVVVVKRRAGRGRDTPRLVVLTEESWQVLQALNMPISSDGAPRIGPGA